MEQMVRVLKSGLEERWGDKIPTLHAIISWIVEYAVYLLNWFEVSRDHKTSYERRNGKMSKTLGLKSARLSCGGGDRS